MILTLTIIVILIGGAAAFYIHSKKENQSKQSSDLASSENVNPKSDYAALVDPPGGKDRFP